MKRCKSFSLSAAAKEDRRKFSASSLPTLPQRQVAVRDVCEGEPAQASIGEGREALGSSCQAIISDGRLWVVLDASGRPGIPRHPTQKGLYLYTLLTNICYFYFYILNSPVSFNLTPLVPEGTEHRLGGLHPGAPPLFSSVAARVRPRHTVPIGTGRPVRGR